MKDIIWATPNRQAIHTGHVTFDRQTSMISAGNHWGKTVLSWHVRGKKSTDCNGFSNPEGHLRAFDINIFKNCNMPHHICEKIIELTNNRGDHGVWVYVFFHSRGYINGYKYRIFHGWVVTDYNHDLLWVAITGPTYKSHNVIETCLQYVAN